VGSPLGDAARDVLDALDAAYRGASELLDDQRHGAAAMAGKNGEL
jgi:hypothetical protein